MRTRDSDPNASLPFELGGVRRTEAEHDAADSFSNASRVVLRWRQPTGRPGCDELDRARNVVSGRSGEEIRAALQRLGPLCHLSNGDIRRSKKTRFLLDGSAVG